MNDFFKKLSFTSISSFLFTYTSIVLTLTWFIAFQFSNDDKRIAILESNYQSIDKRMERIEDHLIKLSDYIINKQSE